MHCADICLSATHNESARKLVMTQFEPCQYRHKSRYASVLQNRCFYTYIWLAYLVRFFERLLRQTTPKLLPLFECLPLLFLLMSLRYSERPNITFVLPWVVSNNNETSENLGTGAIRWGVKNDTLAGFSKKDMTAGRLYDPRFDASWSNPLFGASNKPQVDGIFGMMLIRSF